MADFSIAYKNTGGHEGGWNIDNGGWTYQGISRKGWPGWAGWRYIDAWIKSNGIPPRGYFFKTPVINNLVPAFYKKNYWDKIMGDSIQNQEIANFIYDFYVNSNSALIKINKALGGRSGQYITEDTLAIINARPAFAYNTLYTLRKNHISFLSKKPKLKRYAPGWNARLKSFPSSLEQISGADHFIKNL